MDMVFKLERYRGIQQAGFLFGSDCCRSKTHFGEASQKDKSQRFYTEVQSKTNRNYRIKCSKKQEDVVDCNRHKREQEKSEEKKSIQATKSKGVIHGI